MTSYSNILFILNAGWYWKQVQGKGGEATVNVGENLEEGLGVWSYCHLPTIVPHFAYY